MSEIEKTTPGPWKVIEHPTGASIVNDTDLIGDIHKIEDAHRIVKAVNGHQALLAVCNEAIFLLDRLGDLEFEDLRDLSRDFDGHVEPSICRLRKAVEEARSSLGEVTGDV